MTRLLHTHDGPLALHFRYPHLYPETPRDRLISAAVHSVQAVSDTESLRAWLCGPLRELIPYGKAIAGTGIYADNRYRIDRHESIDFDADYFADYLPRNPYDRSPLFLGWIETRRPQATTIADVDGREFGLWRANALQHGIGNAVFAGYEHGVSTFFSFIKVFNAGICRDEAASRADAIVPLLKDVWSRIVDSEFATAAVTSNPASPPAPISAHNLTAAHCAILAQLREKKSNAEIAAALGKSSATIKTQIEGMLRRTGLPSRHLLAKIET